MKHYMVVSPDYETIYSGDEPPESGCDSVCIHADDERTAIELALKTKEFKPWIAYCRADNSNPFVGVKAFDCKCEHGKCYCWDCNEECEECEKLAEQQA